MAGPRPLLLLMLVGAAATSGAMSAVGIASPAAPVTKAPPTRLGVTIGDDLARRDSKAAQNARALDLREQAIKAAQARLDASLKAKKQGEADAIAASAPVPASGAAPTPGMAEAPDQFDTLAKIYQAMKPAKAAPVFAQLDLEVQYLVAKRMRERNTAMILAAMDPQAAARLSMALAGKRPMLRKKK
jgi:flagellar motility protein MotE (MotC chaperone)